VKFKTLAALVLTSGFFMAGQQAAHASTIEIQYTGQITSAINFSGDLGIDGQPITLNFTFNSPSGSWNYGDPTPPGVSVSGTGLPPSASFYDPSSCNSPGCSAFWSDSASGQSVSWFLIEGGATFEAILNVNGTSGNFLRGATPGVFVK
jgi:hypothetical protein